MTPFGARLREIRKARGMTLKSMAAAIGVSPAYLSALEHGRRGRPTWDLLQRIIGHLNIIWDEAEELERLADLSHPRIVIDTEGLSPKATELANRLGERIRTLDEGTLDRLIEIVGKR
ncbi:MAG: helix-turn-helix family protein [Proteobacteria bacterium]|nr:helix-turn-helix family protein [Pseudomonadota bacterium]